MLHKYVGVQGIVTRIGRVYPLTTKTVHYCEKTKVTSSKTYVDEYDLYRDTEETRGESRSIPVKDGEGNPLVIDYGLCERKN